MKYQVFRCSEYLSIALGPNAFFSSAKVRLEVKIEVVSAAQSVIVHVDAVFDLLEAVLELRWAM